MNSPSCDNAFNRKAKLLDEDDVEAEPVVAGMKPTIAWKSPSLLPENPDAPRAQVSSTEIMSQNERMKTAVAAQYFSDHSVPASPSPMTSVEQAVEMSAQMSATVAKIPFFAQEKETPASVPETMSIPAQQTRNEYAPPPAEAPAAFGATPEFVQALGLPLFLVGQSTQALQTLASSPGLLNSLVDSSGTYDQARLLSLVQTLSGAPAPSAPPAAPPAPYVPQAPPPVPNSYGTSGGYSTYGASSSYGAPRPQGNMRTSDEGNLHVSGKKSLSLPPFAADLRGFLIFVPHPQLPLYRIWTNDKPSRNHRCILSIRRCRRGCNERFLLFRQHQRFVLMIGGV